MAKAAKATKKQLVYIFEYRIDASEPANVGEILDKMREDGAANIIDVRTEEVTG